MCRTSKSRKPTADSRIRINRDTVKCDTESRYRTWLKCYEMPNPSLVTAAEISHNNPMTTPGTATDRAWLTVIAWPDDAAARSRLLERLAESLNSDAPTMRHHVDRSPPTVIG